jgi:hypothetical protein
MNHFYVTLQCDSSMSFFPRNTIAQYNTKLLERIQLKGDYEVALVELLYPQTFHNVYNNDESLYLELVQNGEVVFKYLLEGAHYDNEAVFARMLTEKFNAAISRETDVKNINVKFIFDENMPFEFGKSVVTLHYRRRHNLLPSSS